MRREESADRSGRLPALLLVVGGVAPAFLGIALFGGALLILGPLPDTFAEFAQRWGVRGLAALLVAAGLWCVWTGKKRLR